MKSRIQAIIGNRWLIFALRLILGGCFLAASFGKLQNHSLFVNTVLSYEILPESLARIYGLVLPWVELFIGWALVLGIFPLLAYSLSLLLTISFLIASVYRLAYPSGGDCGCFGQLVQLSTPASLVVDILILIMAIELIIHGAKSGFPSVSDWLGRYSSLQGRKKRIWGIGAGLVIIAVLMVGTAFIPAGSTPSSLDTEINQILSSGRIALLYFYADGCSSCEVVKPVIAELEQKCNQKLTVLKWNYYESPQAVSQFSVVTTPTIIEISGKTKNKEYIISNRLEGSVDVMVLRKILVEPCQ